MRKLLLILIFLLIGILFLIKPVNAISQLHVEGKYIKDEAGNIIYLRGINHGMAFVDHPNSWWRPEGGGIWSGWGIWNPEAVKYNLDKMKSWGMNVVRFHTTVEWWITDNSSYRQHIKDTIIWAEERDMYVIFEPMNIRGDTHQSSFMFAPYTGEPDDAMVLPNEEAFINYYTSVANELKNYSNVLFEIWNEPVGNETLMELFFNVTQRWIDAVRATGADQPLIVQWHYGVGVNLDYPGGMPMGKMTWVRDYPLNDPLNNIIYSFHNYRGDFHRTIPNYTRVWEYDEIKLGMQYCLVDYVLNNLSKPVLVGEIGANMWWTGEELERELAYFNNSLTIYNERNMSYLVYSWTVPAHMRHAPLQNGIWLPPPNEAGQILIDSINPPLMGKLKDKTDNPVQANINVYQPETTNVINATQTNLTGDYKLPVPPGKYDIHFDISSIPNFFIKLLSMNIYSKLQDVINYITSYNSKVSFTVDIKDNQTVQIYSEQKPTRVLMKNITLTEVSSLSELETNTWYYDLNKKKLHLIVNPELKVTCPFDCCFNETNYFDKLCNPNYYCSDNTCIPKEECPYECCVNEEKYLDKTCPLEKFCSNRECVALNKTFGKTNIGLSETGWGNNLIIGSKFSLSENGSVTTIAAYLTSTSYYKAAIYLDNSGVPGALKGISDEIYHSGGWQWKNFTFRPAVSLTSGVYWLVINGNGTAYWFKYDTGSTNQFVRKGSDYNTNPFPNPFNTTTATYYAYNMSVYAIYIPS